LSVQKTTECGPLRHVARLTRFPKSEGRFEGYSGQRPLEGRAGNPEASSRFANRKAAHGCQPLGVNLTFRPSELPALRLGASEARDDALLDTRPLELRNRGQNMQLQPPRWRRCVDALPKSHERNAQRLQFIEQQNQVPEVPPETVQPPADESIKTPSASSFEEFIKGRTAVLDPDTPRSTNSTAVQPGAPHTTEAR
jgi:hypothetical protein